MTFTKTKFSLCIHPHIPENNCMHVWRWRRGDFVLKYFSGAHNLFSLLSPRQPSGILIIINIAITMIIVIMSIMVMVWCITEASEAGSCLSRIPLTGAGHRLRTDTRQLRALSKAKKIRNQDHPEAFKLYLKSELPKLWLCVHK